MKKRMSIMLVSAFLVFLLLALIYIRGFKAKMAAYAKMAPPPTAVTTLITKAQTWQPVLSVVGSLKAVQGVQISTDLAGIVSEIAFESGKPIKKGDLLVKLDTKQEEAQLHSAQARLDLAHVNLERKKDLLEKKAAAQADFDSVAAEARMADAAVEECRALIARKTIIAPFDGILGIRQINVGQYLNVGTVIVALESSDPIYAEFAIPQQHIGKIALKKKIRLSANGVSDAEFDGEITAINSLVDETTRNIAVEATLPNAQHQLRAGMFVNVEVLLPEQSGVLTIPASAISYAPYGDSVYIVKEGKDKDGQPQKQAIQQFVKLGASRGDQISVLSGLKEGDEIVTSGVFKLRSNLPVQINNTVQPGNEENPNPPDT